MFAFVDPEAIGSIGSILTYASKYPTISLAAVAFIVWVLWKKGVIATLLAKAAPPAPAAPAPAVLQEMVSGDFQAYKQKPSSPEIDIAAAVERAVARLMPSETREPAISQADDAHALTEMAVRRPDLADALLSPASTLVKQAGGSLSPSKPS